LLQFPLKLFLSFLFNVFFNLSLDELAFKHFVLNSFNDFHFELVKLVVDDALILHFLFVLLQQLHPHLLVVLLHLDLLQFLPLLLNLLLDLLLLLSQLQLHLSFLHCVAQKHFAVKGLNNVL